MLDFTLDEELQLIIDSVHQFATEKIAPFIREFETKRSLPSSLREEFAHEEWGLEC